MSSLLVIVPAKGTRIIQIYLQLITDF